MNKLAVIDKKVTHLGDKAPAGSVIEQVGQLDSSQTYVIKGILDKLIAKKAHENGPTFGKHFWVLSRDRRVIDVGEIPKGTFEVPPENYIGRTPDEIFGPAVGVLVGRLLDDADASAYGELDFDIVLSGKAKRFHCICTRFASLNYLIFSSFIQTHI